MITGTRVIVLKGGFSTYVGKIKDYFSLLIYGSNLVF
jgi:hypothetical protein